MIPKIVHYCWFGKGEKPDKVKECIQSWKDKLPDYEIIEWNEENFDINALKYTKDAYEARKFAFVSDVARVKALYEFGGIYFDTDVEVLKDFDDSILEKDCVLGFEEGNYIATSFMACKPNHTLMKDFYNLYLNLDFYDEKGQIISGTNVTKLTNMLVYKGLVRNNEYQEIEDISIYPQEYFSPYDYGNCVYKITEKSICVHHFIVSWMSKKEMIKKKIKKIIVPIIGIDKMNSIRKMIKK